MAIAFVQDDLASGNSTSPTVAFGSSTTSGNLIVVALSIFNFTGTVDAVADDKGNTYSNGPTLGGSGNPLIAIFYVPNATGGASHDVTITLSGTFFWSIWVGEYSGAATASVADGSNTNLGGGGTSHTTGSVTPTQDGDLVIGAMTSNQGPGTWGAGGGWTLRGDNPSTSNQTLVTVEQVQGAAGAANPTITSVNSLTNSFGATLAFKAAGGGGGESGNAAVYSRRYRRSVRRGR